MKNVNKELIWKLEENKEIIFDLENTKNQMEKRLKIFNDKFESA